MTGWLRNAPGIPIIQESVPIMWRKGLAYPAAAFILFAAATFAAAIGQGPLEMGDLGSISGQILINGKAPMPGGVAGFFAADSPLPPKSARMHRIPDLVSAVDQQGRFTAKLPAGRYYLGVISRDDPAKTGPPRPGEKSFAAVDKEGSRKIILVTKGAPQELGPITVSFLDPVSLPAEMLTIRGRVINKDGQPFAGASILVRRHPDAKRPDLIAELDGDGQFELQLPAGGPYYLIAKEIPGSGRPQTGRHVGAYTGADPVFDQLKPEPKPVPLSGGAGEILTGITILMLEVPDSEQRKESLQAQALEQLGATGYRQQE
jgi:hypothetical protein